MYARFYFSSYIPSVSVQYFKRDVGRDFPLRVKFKYRVCSLFLRRLRREPVDNPSWRGCF